MSENQIKNEEELKLADIEIEYDIDKLLGKIIIDGIDHSKKVKSVDFSMDARNIPVVKVEFYAEHLKIKANAKVEKQCVTE
ncbi:hypothetical protein [Clostridium kluyveri]|uniref:Uncharacterized protein n=1 Tax=Clostridium kluyveri (strain ATCC 8527 / DSM 555 / NBRC 12016 / NCIMB 10680 / K1) TaxID=431943 RepID=A5N2C2_CLOK5|nr:hypothetical protein [Clostridium kluyveri]EDK35268.1 Hypothetical protein CKL_3265 [Clostridium kluyveri DSM 555]